MPLRPALLPIKKRDMPLLPRRGSGRVAGRLRLYQPRGPRLVEGRQRKGRAA